MKKIWKNLLSTLKYSDTQLYELSISLMMIFINPFHLLGLVKCIHIDSGSVLLLMLGSLIVGCGLFYSVILQNINHRYIIARVYWFYTLFTIVSILKCGFHESGLFASFLLQFLSAIFLIWRLGTEKIYRDIAQQRKK